MKTAMKLAMLATTCMIFTAANANAGKFTPDRHNCQMRVDVEKVQPQNPGDPITFIVSYQFKTPHMTGYMQGGTYPGNLEDSVNDLAIHASYRLCFGANNPHRFDDPCAETDLLITGDLTGFGNFTCPTFQQ